VPGIKINIVMQTYIAICGGGENIVFIKTRITNKPSINIHSQKVIGGLVTVKFLLDFI
jgi:ammonia channel protein AmtB